MTMRRADERDLATVVDLTERAYAPYAEAFGAPPLPVTEDYVPRIAAGEVWLLEDTGGAVGLIVLEDAGDALLVYSVAVAPGRQGEGHGRRLLAFAEEVAAERGRRAVTLFTNARMERNLALYRRCGFVETGRRPNPHRAGWILVDMRKPLAPDVQRRTA